MNRGLALTLLLCLWPGVASAEFPRLEISTNPVAATAVYVRPAGPNPYQHVADKTPVGIELASGTYDVQVEASDGPFFVYRGERTGLSPGFDRATIEMRREVNWVSVLAVGGSIGFGLLALVFMLWMRTRRQHHTMVTALSHARSYSSNTMPMDEALALKKLPNVMGVCMATDGGRVYCIERELGRGGMGAVFEASSVPGDGERYAIKVLLDRPRKDVLRKRFEREIRLCAQLHHPNVVQVLDWGVHQEDSGQEWPFMVMEKVEGTSLRIVIRPHEAADVPVVDLVHWFIEMLAAVRAAHQAGIIHRDLKPDNVMLTHTGHVKVMDFGIAFQEGINDLTNTGQALGTPAYMSPEHLNAKKATVQSDLYSLGVIFYELLCGEVPFDGPDVWAVMGLKLSTPPTPLRQYRADVDRRLEAIVMKMIATSPDQRYRTAQDVLSEFEAWLG